MRVERDQVNVESDAPTRAGLGNERDTRRTSKVGPATTRGGSSRPVCTAIAGVSCVLASMLLALACEGPRGARGASADAGSQGRPGAQGLPGEAGPQGEPGPSGPPGTTPDAGDSMTLPLQPEGVVGVVRDPSAQVVAGGFVYFVPAADVAALAQTPIDLSLAPNATAALTIDEPLEDLLDAHAGDYTRARIGQDGVYVLPKLDAGQYFVVFVPAAEDQAHLPGGSACRSALDQASLAGTQLDLRVSGRPSAAARYVGSSGCLNCHGRHRALGTAHRVGLQVPRIAGAYQDTRAWPAIYDGLQAFDDNATFYFYDCDPTRSAEAKCKVSRTDPTLAQPSAIVSFEAQLQRDAGIALADVGAYALTLVNRQGSGTLSFPVALTYGGALGKQHYLAQSQNANGTLSYFVLPLQWNTAGDDSYAAFEDWSYRDYRSEQWYDFDTDALATPAMEHAFDGQCAGCHLTGMQLTGDLTAGLSAHAASEVHGELDYDGDGRREEINLGCESCHGPGSEHIEARTRGLAIVSPSLLTPERETLLCGRCHSRPLGKLAGGLGAPLGEDGSMPPPWLRRAELAAQYVTRVDGDATDFHASGDSKSHHAQYSDFIRSTMYRNGSVLMTCTSCHDAHGSDEHAHSLLRASNDNAACTGCHSQDEYTAPRGHVEAATGFIHDGSALSDLTCVGCHMVRTVASGARIPALLDRLPDAPRVQYFHGDIASHRFAVTPREAYAAQPVASTLKCGFCHGENLPNQ